jgi:hypothetical protein
MRDFHSIRFSWIVFLFALFVFDNSSAQHAIQKDSAQSRRFLYEKNGFPFALDVNFGLGFTGMGIGTQLTFAADVYHIYIAVQSSGKSGLSDQGVHENSYLIGYRWRDSKNMLCIAAGFGKTTFECTSGENFDCYTYEEGKYDSYPISIEYDWIKTDWLALGAAFNLSFCKRGDSVGLLGILKVGLFRKPGSAKHS